MRTKSDELMQIIYSYIDQYYCEKHDSPSINEIANGVNISKATAYRYLVAMNERGIIKYDGPSRSIVTKMISKFTLESNPCPIVGSIPCGTAEEKEESIREYISLPVSLSGSGKFYILQASGDSMVDEGIDDGDMVVIQTDCDAREGDIVVALTGENENTLKEFGGVDEETEEALLLYRNEAAYPGKKIRVKQLIIQGVAKHVIKAL